MCKPANADPMQHFAKNTIHEHGYLSRCALTVTVSTTRPVPNHC